ncbi:hypothetical protein NDU88_001160 [Pleurodeles waltl]|uniref:SAP domain-containing protein n=1 Tax=Pleurodeles waltl TaxID=8319 RepID=A0AAV7THZ2_PLEWA|nr:hypothetical protein NDU88_001160 [Pleurodeles waltl]
MNSGFTEDYDESDLVPIETLTKAELRELCKDRGLALSKRSTKQELQDAFVAFEEARWEEERAAKDQRGDGPENGNEEELKNDLAVSPGEKREPPETEPITGSYAGSSASSYALSPEELRDRQAERDLRL